MASVDDKLEEELASLRQQLSEESQARKDAELEVEAARKAQERLQGARDAIAARLLSVQQQALDLEDALAKEESAERNSGRSTQELEAEVAALKKGRQRLLEALDVQSAEVDRLQTLNTALLKELKISESRAESCQAQALTSLKHGAHLKDLLEESAGWASDPGSPRSGLEQRCLEAETRASQVQLEKEGLQAALTQACTASGKLEAAVLPVLLKIEAELAAAIQGGGGASE